MKETVARFYDVLIEKKDGMLDALLAEMEGQTEFERYTNEYLVSEIYRNQGDTQQAQLYSGLSKQHKEAYLKAMSSMEFGKKAVNKAPCPGWDRAPCFCHKSGVWDSPPGGAPVPYAPFVMAICCFTLSE